MPKITPLQERFCLAMATPDEEGRYKSQTDAYLEASSTTNRKSANEAACLLMARPEIKDRVAELRAEVRARYLEEKLPFTRLINRISEGLDAGHEPETYTRTGKRKRKSRCKVRPDFGTRRHYIELALKVTGEMPAEKREISGPGGGPIEVLAALTEDELDAALKEAKGGKAT